MKPELTILICTRNGMRSISEAISCCEKEVLNSGKNVEIIVVDNGSTDGTYEYVQSKANQSQTIIKVFHEKKPGKINAFNRGVLESRSDLISIVDDDNFINDKFIEYTLEFFDDYANLGAIGSQNTLQETLKSPDWFQWVRGRYACSRPIIEEITNTDEFNRIVGNVGVIAGAGMTFQRRPLLEAMEYGYQFYNDTQRCSKMTVTGEDVELCWLFRSMGYSFGFDPRIQIIHSLDPSRLTIKSCRKLCATIGAGSVGYDPFMFTKKNHKSITYTWQWQLVSKIKRLAMSYIKSPFKNCEKEEYIFKISIYRIEVISSIKRICKERSKLSKHIRNIANGKWTHLRLK